jgi:hypothetical protein
MVGDAPGGHGVVLRLTGQSRRRLVPVRSPSAEDAPSGLPARVAARVRRRASTSVAATQVRRRRRITVIRATGVPQKRSSTDSCECEVSCLHRGDRVAEVAKIERFVLTGSTAELSEACKVAAGGQPITPMRAEPARCRRIAARSAFSGRLTTSQKRERPAARDRAAMSSRIARCARARRRESPARSVPGTQRSAARRRSSAARAAHAPHLLPSALARESGRP